MFKQTQGNSMLLQHLSKAKNDRTSVTSPVCKGTLYNQNRDTASLDIYSCIYIYIYIYKYTCIMLKIGKSQPYLLFFNYFDKPPFARQLPYFSPWKDASWIWIRAPQKKGNLFPINSPEVSWNGGTPKSSILMGVSLRNQPLWIAPFMETPTCSGLPLEKTRITFSQTQDNQILWAADSQTRFQQSVEQSGPLPSSKCFYNAYYLVRCICHKPESPGIS